MAPRSDARKPGKSPLSLGFAPAQRLASEHAASAKRKPRQIKRKMESLDDGEDVSLARLDFQAGRAVGALRG